MGQIPRSTEHIFSLLFKIIIFYEYLDVVSHVTEQMCHYVWCGHKRNICLRFMCSIVTWYSTNKEW